MCCPAIGSAQFRSGRIPTTRATLSQPWSAAVRKQGKPAETPLGHTTRSWRCTATPTTSSIPSWPITSPTVASRSMHLTCANAADRERPARRRTSSPTWPAMTPNSSTPCPSSTSRTARRRSWYTATPPAGSSCRCGWTGCASAARSPARGSPAWCSIARSWICKARQSCACR
ncbi:Uncharacterised protein [Mycobacterium tuberculosis]|nr:Uncharacterised protein [Mycobacterium tuberculosis]